MTKSRLPDVLKRESLGLAQLENHLQSLILQRAMLLDGQGKIARSLQGEIGRKAFALKIRRRMYDELLGTYQAMLLRLPAMQGGPY